MLFAGSTVGILPVLEKVLGRFFGEGQVLTLSMALLLGTGLILLVLFRGVGQYFNNYLIEWVGNRVVMDLRKETFAHLQNLPVGYFNSTQTGEMISRTVNDSALLERAVATVLTDLARQPIVLVGAIAYAMTRDWRLAVAALLVFPLCLAPILIYGKRVRRAAKEGQERMAEIVSVMQESIRGVRIVKAFCMEAREQQRFDAACQNFFRRVMRVVRSKAMIEPIIILISAVGLVLALACASRMGLKWNEFITMALALVMLYEPVKKLGKIHLSIEQSSAAADRIFEILDTPLWVSDRPDSQSLDGPVERITFDHVGFRYAEEPVLQDIVLEVKAGERIALVGGSGAGKTTLVNLLPRFFDVTGGRLLINGKDVRDLTLRSLRLKTGLVTQDTFLFRDTVAANIAYGAPDASMEKIEAAARKAHAHDFIMQLPNGYETSVGELGMLLSGGQRQRLSIARAILNDPEILILDEATSALDTESERMVQAAIDTLVSGRTVFAIAHRLSTIMNCDRIVVLDKGRIVEIGTHNDLLTHQGIYRRLHDMQFDR
ncbi:MAG TPA: ABC transporter permease [Verrucomicrobia bacterium]|nr:ABC transporter permease [Verrucomicrobiota bacterium]